MFELVRRHSFFGAKQGNHGSILVDGTKRRIATETVNLDRFQGGYPSPEKLDEISLDHSQNSISEDIPTLDFQVEMSAEDHFISNQGKQARGTFQKVDVIRWDHDEEDWNLEEFEFEPPTNSTNQSLSNAPSESSPQQETSAPQDGSRQHQEAFVRLREFALRRRWLSAVAALDKASQQSAPLSKRERAAIEHVLKVAGTFTQHQSDSDLLRRILPNAENREDEVEPVHPSARPKKAAAAKVTTRRLPDSKNNTENSIPTQKEISSSVLRVRQIAARRSWLSPKSSRALAKLGDKKAALGRSETNALNYLLDRCDNISELMVDVENLRKRIGSNVERRG